MGVQRIFISCSLFSLLSSVHAQVVIKEQVVIDPKQQPLPQVSSVSGRPLLRLNGNLVETTIPGVVVSAALSVTPADIPENTAYEVWVNVGGSAHLLKRLGAGYCDATGNESSPFPHTLQGCGVIAMSAQTFVPAPWQWSCSPREAGIDLPIVNGNSATITAYGTLWYTGFTATLTITASLDESYLPAQIVVTPQRDALACSDWSAVDIAVLDGHGNLFTDCNGSPLTGSASIRAKGAYAYLEWTGQIGSSVGFNIMNGRGTFLAVLDTSRGIIEGGSDMAEIRVEVEGKVGTASLLLYCSLPPPSVTITNPGRDTAITLSESNLPNIVFGENHSPGPGEQFEPSIAWDPGPMLSTAAYFETFSDSLVIPVKVTARNVGGTATDKRAILLRKGCNLSPPRYRQADSLWAKDIYDSTKSKISALGCALSSMAMVMTAFGDTVNPGTLNSWMKGRHVDNGGYYGSSVNWNAIVKHSGNGISFSYSKNEESLDTTRMINLSSLDQPLRECSLVVAQVYNSQTGRQHWIVIKEKNDGMYVIVDPGRGESSLAGYDNRIWSYLVVRKN